jgi:homoserine kinase type II
MAVYTVVDDDSLGQFLSAYDIGAPTSCKGIAEGVENSNYLLGTERGTFILTLYEKRVQRADLPYFLGLMHHLAAAGIDCPTPIARRDGSLFGELCGRPAALIEFLAGISVTRIETAHCRAVGEALARLHAAGAGFTLTRANALSVEGWRSLYAAAKARADEVRPGMAEEVGADLDEIVRQWPRELPHGVIHADMFPNNVFFLGERLTGIIDFYFACNDFLAYDLAICLNAWCFERDLSFNATKAKALVAGYGRVRALSAAEVGSLPLLARGSALRFLLTRLYDWLNTPAGALVKPLDPMEYLAKLRFHRHVRSAGAYGL